MNSIHIIGHVGHDAELREGPNGDFATFNVAVNESWKDKNSGEKRTRTTWFRCVANGKLAASAASLAKGCKVEVAGSIRTREYTKGNVEVHTFDVSVAKFAALTAEPNGGGE